jgi:hypothetical protein
MPLTSGPVSIYLMLEQGRGFAALSAVSSLVSIGAVALFSLTYGLLCVRQWRIFLCAWRFSAETCQGAYGVGVFYTVVGLLVLHWDPALTYTIAILSSILISLPWLPWRQTARVI